MKIYICDTFSLAMINRDDQYHAVLKTHHAKAHPRIPFPVDDPARYLHDMEVACEAVNEKLHVVWNVTEGDTAWWFGDILNREPEPVVNRQPVSLGEGEYALIGLFVNSEVQWWRI